MISPAKSEKRAQFLSYVRTYIETDPEAAAYVSDHVQEGLRLALTQANERASDMEVALSVLAAKRYKGADEIVKGRLKKWQGKTELLWDWLVP